MSDTWILYQTTNVINSKIYVGVHKLADTAKSRRYLGSGKILKPAIEKYGRENFVREILAEFSCFEDAYSAEAEMVTEEFIKRKDTYNISLGGRGRNNFTHTEETKAKISASSKGKVKSEETRAKHRNLKHTEEAKTKIRNAQLGNTYSLGYKHSEEAKSKISAANKDKILSKETKTKISESKKGKAISEETKTKISKARLGSKRSIETRLKMSNSQKGKKYSEQSKIKMSNSQKGKVLSKETKDKIAATLGKPVIENGKYYLSLTQAAEFHKISNTAVRWRIKNLSPKWSEWRFATEEEVANFSARN
jgi:hypothetical protein